MSSPGVEPLGDEAVARVLATCKGATEPVLDTYEQLLSNGAILPSPNLRLRLPRSVLVVLREWAINASPPPSSLLVNRMEQQSRFVAVLSWVKRLLNGQPLGAFGKMAVNIRMNY